MEFRPARQEELAVIHTMYRTVAEEPLCAWDEEYPGWLELDRDYVTGNLFVLTEGDFLAGALSIVPENELDHLPCWHFTGGNHRELARIVIAPSFRGRGLARHMVEEVLPILKRRGCTSVRLSAALTNPPAVKTYQHAGFQTVGEADLFGGRYALMELGLE